jgi:hypothetical protein
VLGVIGFDTGAKTFDGCRCQIPARHLNRGKWWQHELREVNVIETDD